MDFTRADASATCNPRQLANEITAAIGKTVTCDINQATVIVYEDVTGSESEVQAVIDDYVYDPDYGRNVEALTARDALRDNLSTLATATKDKSTWDGLSAEQRQDATRVAIRSFVLVCRFLAKRFLERGT